MTKFIFRNVDFFYAPAIISDHLKRKTIIFATSLGRFDLVLETVNLWQKI